MASIYRVVSAFGSRQAAPVLCRCWAASGGPPESLLRHPAAAASVRHVLSHSLSPATGIAPLLAVNPARRGAGRVRCWASGGGESAPVEEIRPAVARDMVDAAFEADPTGGGVQLVDVREPREIQAANLGKYGWRWTALPLNSQFEEWREDVADGELLDPSKPTLVLCHAGIRSRFVAQYLTQECGFSKVYNITGGIDAWSSYDPDIPRY
mmetsp:Transcript_19996/g.50420  ORF Transcript_19996/g.50420 Transcript_19996/m.50420 type:complete len:210 (+) Transcript_19996:177-806(+)